jgi:hypothetical protein
MADSESQLKMTEIAANSKWHKIHLSLEQVQGGGILRFQGLFNETYKELNFPEDFALLISEPPDHVAVPDQTYLYFTPLASHFCKPLIDRFQGVQCPEPSPAESQWLAGDDRYLSQEREQRALRELMDTN